MIVLAFDTATSSCAITLWQDGEVLAEAQKMLARGHAEVLVPMIEAVLAEAGLDYADLDVLAVTIGPGAFTGIRIGLATARSLALASGLPLIGVTNFDALVHGLASEERHQRNVLVVLETKRTDFYACLYGPDLSPLAAPKAVDEAGLQEMAGAGPVLVCGDVQERVMAILQAADLDAVASKKGPHVETAVVAALAAARFKLHNESGAVIEPPLPLYLKPPDVNMSGVKPPSRVLKP